MYKITTIKGLVPHITDLDKEYYGFTFIVFIDDILYTDSYYENIINSKYTNTEMFNLNKFLNLKTTIQIRFKGSEYLKRSNRRVLDTFKGKYYLTKENYDRFIAVTGVKEYEPFDKIDKRMPVLSLNEAIDLLKLNKEVETGFIHVLTDNYFTIDNDRVVKADEYSFKCSCCIKYNSEYMKYLIKIKEANAKTIIQHHNYVSFYKLAKNLEKLTK